MWMVVRAGARGRGGRAAPAVPTTVLPVRLDRITRLAVPVVAVTIGAAGVAAFWSVKGARPGPGQARSWSVASVGAVAAAELVARGGAAVIPPRNPAIMPALAASAPRSSAEFRGEC